MVKDQKSTQQIHWVGLFICIILVAACFVLTTADVLPAAERMLETDADNDGRVDFKEYYDAAGKLVKRQEKTEGSDQLDITWYYNESGIPFRAERDTDADGSPDIWYSYKDGQVTAVRQDSNYDGKPDIWEEYDKTETLIKRKKDLNHDGVADFFEDFSDITSDAAAGVKPE